MDCFERVTSMLSSPRNKCCILDSGLRRLFMFWNMVSSLPQVVDVLIWASSRAFRFPISYRIATLSAYSKYCNFNNLAQYYPSWIHPAWPQRFSSMIIGNCRWIDIKNQSSERWCIYYYVLGCTATVSQSQVFQVMDNSKLACL